MESQNSSQLTSTGAESDTTTSLSAMPEVQIPDVLNNLESKGVKFTGVPFMNYPRASIVKDRSVYLSVDTIVTSQVILEAFNATGINIDTITCIKRKTSNKS